jgi:hypothetical protein
MRAAASSSASGTPSRRWHIRATVNAFCSVSAKFGAACLARSTKSCTASLDSTSASGGAVPATIVGNESGRNCHVSSPLHPSGTRLVARIERRGQLRKRFPARSALASTRCSQLSRTRSRCLSRSASVRVATSERPGWSYTPRTEATVPRIRAGSDTEARSAIQAPAEYVRSTSAATRNARRVLPAPPTPVRVISLLVPSRSISSIDSCCRPMKLLISEGRL